MTTTNAKLPAARQAKHTPGPWQAHGTKIKHLLDSGLTENIADVRGGRFGEVNDTAHANARLIAAAPDLLEELRGIVQFFDLYVTTLPDRNGREMLGIDFDIESACAAIAKATGQDEAAGEEKP